MLGGGAGLLIRALIYAGEAGSASSAMAAGFIFCAPLAMGALTVYLAERQARRSFGYYVMAPMLATVIMVLGSFLTLLEGVICAILILPVFSVMGAVGGVLMGIVCRWTQWPKATLNSLLALPLILALAGTGGAGPQHLGTVERSLFINASPAAVWALLHNLQSIRVEEVDQAWTYRIGIPRPMSCLTVEEGEQRVRKIVWDKGVHFDEVIQAWEPERHVRWTYRFGPDSVPPGALDDHVQMGGHYFDLTDTAYTLTREGSGVRLHLRISYRLSTDFNVYAEWLAQNLMGNFAQTILALYQRRAETAEAVAQLGHR